jgi:hypothetical protein
MKKQSTGVHAFRFLALELSAQQYKGQNEDPSYLPVVRRPRHRSLDDRDVGEGKVGREHLNTSGKYHYRKFAFSNSIKIFVFTCFL